MLTLIPHSGKILGINQVLTDSINSGALQVIQSFKKIWQRMVEKDFVSYQQEIIKELKGLGVSKYAIAKRLSKMMDKPVAWNTVHMWAKGIYKPSEELGYRKALQILYIEELERNGKMLNLFESTHA